MLCLQGEITLDDAHAPLVLPRGAAAVGPAMATPLRLMGAGEAYVASVAG